MIKTTEVEGMNAGTLIVLIIIALLVYVCVRYLVNNGLDSCTGECSGCGPVCKWSRDIQKAQRSIARKKKIKKLLHIS